MGFSLLPRFATKPVSNGHVASDVSPNDAPVQDPTDASGSPAVDGHVQLHSRSHARSAMSSVNGVATPNEAGGSGDGGSGKDKPTPRSAKDAVVHYFRHNWIVVIYSTVSLATVVLLIYFSFFAAVMDDGKSTTPEFLSCRSWSYGTDCGLWGIDCRPFESEWSAIRCRSRCSLDQSSSLAVYGTGLYRADSRICRAAIHAGVIGANGGCAMMRYAGAATTFSGTTANGVTTQGFTSWFPKTFEFKTAPSSYCTDLTWSILVVGVVILFGYSLLPRTNAAILYAILVTWGFFYVRLVGHPPSLDYVSLAINAFGQVLVLLAATYWLYSIAPKYTFAHWATLPLRQRVVMWGVCYVLPFYICINMNMLEYLPWLNFDLGGYEESTANAGTYIVIALLILVVLYCAFWFLRELYRQSLWRRYLVWYGVVITAVFLTWALFPSTSFHLHHSMLGVFLFPLTRFPTPLAAAAQSALLGVFVQGYTAWGWSSYLDTMPTYLTINKPTDAPVAANVTSNGANLSWAPVEGVDGYSVRVNKVEVYRGVHTTAWISELQPNLTYFVRVAAVAEWGTNGQEGPTSNFTTLP